MTITTYGTDPNITELRWAQLFEAVAPTSLVLEGFATTVSGSSLVVAAGRTYQSGTLTISDSSVTLPVTANAGSQPRVDRLVMQTDWSGDSSTSSTLRILTGTPAASPVEPGLTQTAGVLWQTPLYRFRVAAGSSVPINLTGERQFRQASAVDKGYTTATVNGSGDLTITHSLGAAPAWFTAECTNWNVQCTPNWNSRTATSFSVSLHRRTDWQPLTSGSYSIVWKAEA